MVSFSLLSILRVSILLGPSKIGCMRTSRSNLRLSSGAAVHSLGGQRLGNYILQTHYKNYKARGEQLTNDVASPGSLLQSEANRTEVIPPSTFKHASYNLGDYLRSGSYGVAYLAQPVGQPEETVVLKFIYTFKQETMYIATGKKEDEKEFGRAIKELARECNDLQKIQRAQASDIQGASRIVSCRDMCVSAKYGDGDCDTAEDDAQFIVMDYAGQNGEEWLRANYRSKRKIAAALEQIAQGLAYLSILDPPVIHHDLKWDNVAVRMEGKDPMVQLIDFGAAVEVTGTKNVAVIASTPGCAPPEWYEGYAYYGPAHAFDAYSFGTMVLEGLCDVPWFFIAQLEATERKLFNEATYWYPDQEINLDRLDLRDMQGSPGGNELMKRCRMTTEELLHPDPERRLPPKAVGIIFSPCGDGKTCPEISKKDGTPPRPAGTHISFNPQRASQEGFLKRLEAMLDNGPQKADTWDDLKVAWGWGESVAMCMGRFWKEEAQHGYFKDVKLRVAMKKIDSGAVAAGARYTHMTFPFCMMMSQVEREVLHPLSINEDRKFSACALNHAANHYGEQGKRSMVARAQVSLLQWGEIWNRRQTPAPSKTAKGSQFAYGLLFGTMTSRNFATWRFQFLLDKVKVAAKRLFRFSGEAAAPSWKSGVTTFFSDKALKKYRKLYRRLYYVFNSRLQAAAMRMACAATHAMSALDMLQNLHQLGHKHVTTIRSASTQCRPPVDPMDAPSKLEKLLTSVEQLRQMFINPRSSESTFALPDLRTFDDTHGWDQWENDPEDYYARNGTAKAFNILLGKYCPTAEVPFRRADGTYSTDGMYSNFRSHVVHNLMSGLAGLFEVLENRDEEFDPSRSRKSSHKRNFVFGVQMREEAQKAGDALSKFVAAQNLSNSDFQAAAENAANMEKAVIAKFYDQSNDDDYDRLGHKIDDSEGAVQPGGIFDLKSLIAAVLEVVVHPSQEAFDDTQLTQRRVARSASFQEEQPAGGGGEHGAGLDSSEPQKLGGFFSGAGFF